MSTSIESIKGSPTNAAVGFLAGLASTLEVREILGIPHLFNPLTGAAESLEHLLPRPLRDKTQRELLTVESFNEYVKRFKQPSSSIYTKKNSGGYVIIAEIDHRTETETAWHSHSAAIGLKYSEPLQRWIELNKRQLSQDKFADLLEERALDIKSPSAAEILELAQSLHVTRNLSVKSMVRSNRSANSISFNQDQSLKAGRDGNLELPTSFIIDIEPFARHREHCQIKALLRPRIEDDKPVFTYELQLVEESIEEALGVILNAIGIQTSLPVYR